MTAIIKFFIVYFLRFRAKHKKAVTQSLKSLNTIPIFYLMMPSKDIRKLSFAVIYEKLLPLISVHYLYVSAKEAKKNQ